MLRDSPTSTAARSRLSLFIETLERRVLLSTYYVTTTGGSDANPGTLAAPFATIQQAANVAQPGDTVLIHGGTYRETVHPLNSGTAAAPITFAPFGDGTVMIDGADPVVGWSKYSGSIYSAPLAWTLGEGSDQVFLDGQMMTEAQWPNTSLDPLHHTSATADSVSATINQNGLSTATIHSSALTDPAGSWVGGIIRVSPGQAWIWQSGTVISNSPGVLTYTYQQLTSYEVPTAGNHFYLTGKFQGLDSPGEWYRDPTSNTLYLWAPTGDSPASHNVEAKQRLYGFDLSGDSYINLQGLQLFACTVNTDANSTHDNLTGIGAKYLSQQLIEAMPWNIKYAPHTTGIILNGSFDVVDSCTITYSSGDGVFLGGSNNIVRNSVISEVDYGGGDEAGVSIQGSDNQVVQNTIYDVGRSGVTQFFSAGVKIFYNSIHDFAIQDSDCGGIYTWETDGQGSRWAYNKVYNGLAGGYGATGVFLDGDCNNFRVDHNIVYNVNTALKMNYAQAYDRLFNNTFVGINWGFNGGTPVMTNVLLANNLFSGSMFWGTGAIQYHNLVASTGRIQYVSPSSGDFRLMPGSPAIDAGIVEPPYTDGYSGAAPDLGALEAGTQPFVTGAPIPAGIVKTTSSKSLNLPANASTRALAPMPFSSSSLAIINTIGPSGASGTLRAFLDSLSGDTSALLILSIASGWNTFVV